MVLALIGASVSYWAVSRSDEAGPGDGVDRQVDASSDRTTHPIANKDHWHAAFGIYDCEQYLDPLSDGPRGDVTGIHTHSDGLIHIHPFLRSASGANARLGKFFDTVGLEVPGSFAERCNGAKNQQRLLIWDGPDDATASTVTKNIRDVRFARDGMVFALVSAPEGARVPQPASVANLEAPGDVQAQPSSTCPPAEGTATRTVTFASPPPMCLVAETDFTAIIETDVGTIRIALNSRQSPTTVNNFVFLARNHFFDGVVFHRVIPDFVVQGGDPLGTGSGGPGYQFEDEIPAGYSYSAGEIAMANSGPDTNGSQFFLVVSESAARQLTTATGGEAKYSPFGRVTAGLEVVRRIEADGSAGGAPTVVHKMLKVVITEA